MIDRVEKSMPKKPSMIIEQENAQATVADVVSEVDSVFRQEYTQKIRLADLEAALVNKTVSVECQIVGEQEQKALIKEITLSCNTCNEIFHLKYKAREVLFKKPDIPKKCLEEDCGGDLNARTEYRDYAILYVRDLLNKNSNSPIKKFKQKTVYLLDSRLPTSKTVKILGEVFIEPKTKDLVIISDAIEPLATDFEQFKVTDKHRTEWPKYFGEGKEVWRQINPDVIGLARDVAKQAYSLQLHSPCRIFTIDKQKVIRGGLNVIFFGDTKVCKTEIGKDATSAGYIPLGELITAETGSRTGILYTINNDKEAVIWGALVLNDMGLLVIDGLQAMHAEEMGEMREAIEQQTVKVCRSVSAEALARTRILGCMNPRQVMANYLFKCQAITDSWIFCKTPDITRIDLFIPFCQKDVNGKDIAFRVAAIRPIPDDVYKDHIHWVWSRKPENIQYTEAAVYRIKQITADLISIYNMETLPIVHNGCRDLITRLAVAKAAEMHSTDETHENIIVESSHVDSVVAWYKQLLEMLELENFKSDIEGRTEIDDSECIKIAKELGQTEYAILQHIKHKPQSSTQLAAVLDLSTKSIKNHYKLLQDNGLIEAESGVGICLTVKGTKFARWAMLNPGEMGKKDLPNEGTGEEKVPQLPLDSESIQKVLRKKGINPKEPFHSDWLIGLGVKKETIAKWIVDGVLDDRGSGEVRFV